MRCRYSGRGPCRIFAFGGLLLAALLSGCGPSDPSGALTELPAVATDSFIPAVAEQLVALQEAVADDPRDAGVTGRLGMAYLAYRQDHAAEVALNRARMLQPQEFKWAYYHGEALSRLGRLDEAVAAFEDARSMEPGYPRTDTRLGLIYLQLGDLDSAHAFLSASVNREPGNAEARLGLARLLLRTGELDEARAHLELILDELGGVGSVYFVLSDAWRMEGNGDKARDYLTLFEQYRVVGVPVRDPLLQAVLAMDLTEKPLLQAARTLIGEGRDAEAIELLNRALERNPESHLTHAALVGAYGALRQFDKVEEHYRLALASGAPTASLLRNLGRARVYQGKLGEARHALQQALVMNPHDAIAFAWLGIVYLQLNDAEQGIAMLTVAAQKDPRESMARFVLAEVLNQQGRPEEALVYLQQLALPERKGTPRAWRLMGEAYLQLDRQQEAREAFASAVASAERLGDDEEARRSEIQLRGLAK